MEFIKDIIGHLAAMLTSIGIVALLGFAFREYVRRYVDHLFNTREERTKHENAIQVELLKTNVPMLQEISELVYRLRDHARAAIAHGSPISESCALHREVCSLLTQRLYTYRGLLDEVVWEKLHKFKRFNQDFTILVDIASRPETYRENRGQFSAQTFIRLEEIYKEIDKLYSEIPPALRERLHV